MGHDKKTEEARTIAKISQDIDDCILSEEEVVVTVERTFSRLKKRVDNDDDSNAGVQIDESDHENNNSDQETNAAVNEESTNAAENDDTAENEETTNAAENDDMAENEEATNAAENDDMSENEEPTNTAENENNGENNAASESEQESGGEKSDEEDAQNPDADEQAIERTTEEAELDEQEADDLLEEENNEIEERHDIEDLAESSDEGGNAGDDGEAEGNGEVDFENYDGSDLDIDDEEFVVSDHESEAGGSDEDEIENLKEEVEVVTKISRTRKRKHTNAEMFIDNEASGSEDEDDDSEPAEVEYDYDKAFEIPPKILSIYRIYIKLSVLFYLRPGWQTKMEDALSKAKAQGEAALKSMQGIQDQYAAWETVTNIIKTAGACIINWVREGVGRPEDEDRTNLYNMLMSIKDQLFTAKVEWMDFERSPMKLATCVISGSIVKNGQGWVVKARQTDGEIKTDIVKTQWWLFLSYWQYLFNQNLIIEKLTDEELADDKSTSAVDQLANGPLPERMLRMLMATLAWFYRLMHSAVAPGKSYVKFCNSIDSDWYTICGK